MIASRRIRGSAGVKLRKARLFSEPLCRHCAEQGRITVATTPDHIVPLAKGGTDTDDNVQCLCGPCHDAKTRKDFGWREAPREVDPETGWPIEPTPFPSTYFSALADFAERSTTVEVTDMSREEKRRLRKPR